MIDLNNVIKKLFSEQFILGAEKMLISETRLVCFHAEYQHKKSIEKYTLNFCVQFFLFLSVYNLYKISIEKSDKSQFKSISCF